MALLNIKPVYLKSSDLPDPDDKYNALNICVSADVLVPNQVNGAQGLDGVWSVWLKSQNARKYLIETAKEITLKKRRRTIYDEYPTVSRKLFTEKVIFKDLPFDVCNQDILDYLYSQPGIQIKTRDVIASRMRNEHGDLKPFYSGDRFVYVNNVFKQVLPAVADRDHYRCRILHRSQDKACKWCRHIGYYTRYSDLWCIHWRS